MSEIEIIKPNENELLLLLEREGRIERCQRNAYYEIGLELKAIRDGQLYKTPRENPVAGKYGFNTFEEYCGDRWEMDANRANKLITCAGTAEKMGKICTTLPARESHVRALLKLEDDADRAEVWRRVSENGGITARAIEDEVKRYKAEMDKDWITLEEWGDMPEEDQFAALKRRGDKGFNYQDNDNIEWARWSWNPVTGCRHGCDYCYARDIAARFYPQGFAPTIIPSRLSAPSNTAPKKPKPEWTDIDHLGHKNVFTCSMADLFGKWVPDEWIEAVFSQVRDNPDWNFLFLSKFPIRMAEFDWPSNAWAGASVDKQGAVKRAERAFEKIDAGVKWLSCEPMLEKLTFSSLEMFDWVVIGGASSSTAHEKSDIMDAAPSTPEFRPPFDWIHHLHSQAKDAGCKIYQKTNLLGARHIEYPA